MAAIESMVLGRDQEQALRGFMRFSERLGLKIEFQDRQPITNEATARAIFGAIPGMDAVQTNPKFAEAQDWKSLSILGELTDEYEAMKQFADMLPESTFKRTVRRYLMGFETVVRDEVYQVGNGRQKYVPERYETAEN